MRGELSQQKGGGRGGSSEAAELVSGANWKLCACGRQGVTSRLQKPGCGTRCADLGRRLAFSWRATPLTPVAALGVQRLLEARTPGPGLRPCSQPAPRPPSSHQQPQLFSKQPEGQRAACEAGPQGKAGTPEVHHQSPCIPTAPQRLTTRPLPGALTQRQQQNTRDQGSLGGWTDKVNVVHPHHGLLCGLKRKDTRTQATTR